MYTEIKNLFFGGYTGIFGDYAYLLIASIILIAIYNKSESVAGPTILGILVSAAFAGFLPSGTYIAILMLLVTGACAVVYKVAAGAER